MHRNGYLWTSGVHLDTAVRFADPDFLLECKISAIWRRFPLIFCILYVKCPPYFYFWFVWPTDLESIPHASTPTSIIPTRFEVDMIIHAELVFSSADTSRDLEQMSYMASHMTKLATKYEDPTPIRSWVMSYNVSRWLYHWKYVLGHCACAEPCDPWVGGQKQLHFWMESPTPICLFTM